MADDAHAVAGVKRAPIQQRVRDWFARSLGVKQEKKEEIYLQISRSATLTDVSYWSQVFFSAGIATLGLALNSPAVIIGAMLISPLMGPILASGLALATGDFVLAARAAANLLLSCLLAILFAVVLVALLPFKEITAEIAARTQPNTLDLVVALFSGAVGSIAICKEVKGVVTSIPGRIRHRSRPHFESGRWRSHRTRWRLAFPDQPCRYRIHSDDSVRRLAHRHGPRKGTSSRVAAS